MPDFSDRYKKALEYQEISPDFKERTAKLMTELRDEGELIPKTAEDEQAAASFTVSDNEDIFPRRINKLKIVSAMAAAAACLTVGVALSEAGVFDKGNEPETVYSDSIVTEATDSLETFEETMAGEAENAAPASDEVYTATAGEGVMYHGTETSAIAGNGSSELPEVGADGGNESHSEESFQTADAEPAVSETEPNVTEAIITSAPKTEASGDSNDIAAEAEYEQEGIDEASPVIEAPSEAASQGAMNAVPAETVLELAPFNEEYGGISVHETVDYEEEEEETVDEAAPSDMSRSSDFSPKRAVAGFPAQTSSALITPSFEDTISEDGTVVKYQPKRIRSVTKLLALNKELYAYTDEDSAAVGSEAPSDSRYIIDYAGDDGKAMRIYIGSRYICFAYEGGYYTYELTEEEYKALDSSLFGLVS